MKSLYVDNHNPAFGKSKGFPWLLVVGLLCGIIAAVVLRAGVVRSIDAPTSITITTIRAYSGTLETDDLLVVVHYNVPYGTFPSEQISDAYVGRFLRGTTELNSVEPFAYNDRGYGVGIFSFYWTAAERSSDSIEFNDSNGEGYIVIFQGKPGVFPGSTPTTQSTDITWRDSTRTVILLRNDIAALARTLEENSEWVNDSRDLIAATAGTTQLTSAGEEYFAGAIPNLQVMIPDLFSSAAKTVPNITRTFNRTYERDLNAFWQGNWVDTRFNNLATQFRMPKSVITSMIALLLASFIAGAVMKISGPTSASLELGLMSYAVTLPLFTVVNWIPLPVTLFIAFIAVLGIGWTFWGRRAA